jgi:hypothetical protein
MKRKTIILALLLSIGLLSCAPTIQTPTIVPTSTIFWITPVASPTGQPTITPRVIEPFIPSNNTEDISNIIVQIYSIKLECTHSVFIDNPELKTKVEFLDVEEPDKLDISWVQAITYSPDKSRQAYIACIVGSVESQGCSDHVYVKDKTSSKVFEIEFHGHQSWRPILNITWIGNDVLAFTESSSPQVDTIYAIDLAKREYLYYSLYYGQCE